MLQFLADENFNEDIVRGLWLREATIDVALVRDVGLGSADDPDVLAWAAQHDRATMPDFAYDRVAAGASMPGVFVLNDRLPVRQAIDEVLLMVQCSDRTDWIGRVVHVPI